MAFRLPRASCGSVGLHGFPRVCPSARQPISPSPCRLFRRSRNLTPFSSLSDAVKLVSKLPAELQPKFLKALTSMVDKNERLADKNERLAGENASLSHENASLAHEIGRLAHEVVSMSKQLSELKDNMLSLERDLIAAMRRAGVVDARSLLEYIKRKNDLGHLSNTNAWKVLLKAKPELVECLLEAIPSWSRGIKDKKQASGVVASNIAALHSSLSNQVHSFDVPWGLTIYEGVPDEVTTLALVCIASYFNIPHKLKERADPQLLVISGDAGSETDKMDDATLSSGAP